MHSRSLENAVVIDRLHNFDLVEKLVICWDACIVQQVVKHRRGRRRNGHTGADHAPHRPGHIGPPESCAVTMLYQAPVHLGKSRPSISVVTHHSQSCNTRIMYLPLSYGFPCLTILQRTTCSNQRRPCRIFRCFKATTRISHHQESYDGLGSSLRDGSNPGTFDQAARSRCCTHGNTL